MPSRDRSYFEARLGANLGSIRLHDDTAAQSAARRLGASAFALGSRIGFAERPPAADDPKRAGLLAHELVHTLQPDSGTVVRRQPAPGAAATTIDVEIIGQMDVYVSPSTGGRFRVGDAAGPKILMQIEAMAQGGVVFRWFNFAAGETVEGRESDWNLQLFYAGMMGNGGFTALGRQLPAAKWRQLWPNPMPALLILHEQGGVTLPDDTILAGYRGMIFQQGLQTLTENEAQVDALLQAPDRVQRIQEYATGLKEASVVRDALVAHLDQIRHSQVQAHGFTFGAAGNYGNMDPYRRIKMAQEEGEAESALQFWLSAFPMLTRIQTAEIRATRVEDELRGIKASIVTTRADLMKAQVGRGALDLMELGNVRARLQDRLGPRSAAVIEAEDRSHRRTAIAVGVGMFALSIALLFLPGGIFLDAAIGAAMAVTAVDRARALGNAANTGLNIDEGLATQSAAHWAEFGAVLAVVGAALGSAAAGFRILRFASAFRNVRAATQGLDVASHVSIARLMTAHPELARVLRSTGELQAIVGRLGVKLTPAELQGLRATIYFMQRQIAGGSRQGLQSFLDLVWANRAEIAAGRTTVYKLYSGASGNAALTRSETSYLNELASLARGRPAGAVSHIQRVTGMEAGDHISAIVAEAAGNAGKLAAIRSKFFMFFRAGTVRNGRILPSVGERVYVNVVADEAPKVLQSLVRHVVDDPSAFPGVVAAKLTGPGGVAARADAIVIYMENQAASGRVLDWLREFQAANPRLFQQATPQMTETVTTGIAVGAEPVASAGGASFGGLRSDLIKNAVQSAAEQNLGREQFGALVDRLFRESHIDPNLPHTNLP